MPGGSAWIRRARCPTRVAACWPKVPIAPAWTPAKWRPCAAGPASATWQCCWSAADEPAGELLAMAGPARSEEHTSELQSQSNLVCRLLLEKKKKVIQQLQREYARAPD